MASGSTVPLRDDSIEKLRTVKCCLGKRLVQSDVHLPRIEKLVEYVSKAARNGSAFVNLYLLHHLRSNNGVLPPFVDLSKQSFFYGCFLVCTGSYTCQDRVLSDSFDEVVLTYWEDVFQYISLDAFERLTGTTQAINEAAKLYHTNFKNHHEVPLFQRMKKYVRCRLTSTVWTTLTPAQKGAVSQYLYAEDAVFPAVDALQTHQEWISEVRSRYLGVKVLRNGDSGMYWRKLVEFTYWLGLQLHDFFEDQPARPISALRSNKKGRPRTKKKPPGHHQTFSIAPVCKISRQSVVISETIMSDYFGLKGPGCWERLFHSGIKTLRSSVKGWKFAKRVTTDGVSLNVLFEKPGKKAQKQTAAEKKTKKKLKKAEACQGVPERLIAVDPGCVNMFFAVERVADGSVRTWKYRTKEYYHEAFIWKSRNAMDLQKRICSDELEQLSNCLLKTVVIEKQLEYWSVYARNAAVMFPALATRKRCKLAMNTYIHGLKSIDGFLKKFKDGSNVEPKVAYGAAQFSSCIRGTLPTPTDKGRKRCCLMYDTCGIDESYTSQYCPYCNQMLHAPRVLVMCKDGVERYVESRSVKRCTSPECLSRASQHSSPHVLSVFYAHGAYEMSRDKVGALNILKCAIAEFTPGELRPAHLCRRGQVH